MRTLTEEEKKEWQEWYDSRPEVIKALIDKYPPGTYQITEGAPYILSGPGTHVQLEGYTEDGLLIVFVLAKDKLPKAIEHEVFLGNKFNHSPEKIEEFHKYSVRVNIEPQYAIKIEDDEQWN